MGLNILSYTIMGEGEPPTTCHLQKTLYWWCNVRNRGIMVGSCGGDMSSETMASIPGDCGSRHVHGAMWDVV